MRNRVIHLSLSRSLIEKNHKLYFDTFFQFYLQKNLLTDNICACGTTRKTRKQMPNDFRDDKLMNPEDSGYRVHSDGIVPLK